MAKNCRIEFGENSFSIDGISEEPIEIRFDGDIDITPFVEGMIELIDSEEQLCIETTESPDWDDKKKLIHKLITEIIEKYNGCLSPSEGDEEKEKEQDEVPNNSGSIDSVNLSF